MKVISISTATVGDNVHEQMMLITTILYDNGDVYEGFYEVVSTEIDPQLGCVISEEREMKWRKIELPV